MFHFQPAFLMRRHTSKCVAEVLDRIENTIGTALFTSLSGVILTGNGHEFMDFSTMERSVNGGRRTTAFYCESDRSDEKGSCPYDAAQKLFPAKFFEKLELCRAASADVLLTPALFKGRVSSK